MDYKKLSDDLSGKLGALKTERKFFEEAWEDIGKYVYLDKINTEMNSSRRGERNRVLYDGTAVAAHDLMVNGLLGYLVSRVSNWIKIRHTNAEIMDYPVVRKYFQEVEEQMYAEFNNSNFYEQITAVFSDGGSFGTAGLHIEEDVKNQRINFSARPPKELYIAENKFGYVDTIFRNYFMTTKQIISSFQKKGNKAKGNMLKERWIKDNNKSPYKKHAIVHAMYPREDRIQGRIDNMNKEIESVYMFESGDILRVSGMDELDVVWRWSKNTDEEYGRSPAWRALTDILRINTISRDLLELGNYAARPAMMYPSSMEYMMNINPDGKIPYTDPNMPIMPIKKGEYPIGRDREEKIEQSIRDHFHVDFFLGLSQVTKTMTIPEVMERQGEKAAVLGTTVGRINSELLDPTIERTYQIASDAGRMPEVPEILAELGGEAKIEYVGLLAQIQKRYMGTQGITRVLEQIMPIANLDPSVLDNIDFDKMTKELMVQGSLPETLIRSDEDVAKIRQQKAAQAANAQKMAQIESMGKAANGLNQAVVPESPLEALNAEMAQGVQRG